MQRAVSKVCCRSHLLAALGVAFFTICSLSFDTLADQSPSVQNIEIAAALPLTGDESTFGTGSIQGIQLAIEEANANGLLPHINLRIYDDQSSDDKAKEVASQIVTSGASVVLGPALSTSSLAAGPVYAQAGLASITTTATADAITENATTFRVVFKNSEQGQTLAIYLARVLRRQSADVIVVDNGYGHSLQAGFENTTKRLGMEVQFFLFKTPEEAEQIAQRIAADTSQSPVVFLTLDADAARILPALRRLGVRGPFLGGDALGDESFSGRMTNLPEEREQPGYFSDGVYGISPMILDSANAETLAFADRFRARFGHDPIWFSAAGYDAARLAVATARAAAANQPADTRALRAAILSYLVSSNGPARSLPGLLGPLLFDQARGRQQAIRVGRFSQGRFESAPLQIVPVTEPDMKELASGAVFELEAGRYARLQRVVYTGIFINEIPHVDISKSSFGADFYVWLRFARDAGPDSSDPTDIHFPNLLSGSFDRAHPAEQGQMPDGTEYRLWRVQGEFRNDFDLHRFPFDRQTLSLPFFNARAAADRIVYVLDRRSPAHQQSGSSPAVQPGWSSVVSPTAFRNLTQWDTTASIERRENLVTESTLGDPRRSNGESVRELSGFLASVDLKRRVIATLTKTLLPLLLMSLIMYASLYFPAALVKEKVTVAVTAALSGAVLLTAINSQLGGVGYTIAVEYAFYLFFFLSLLCIVSVLGAERLRAAGRTAIAVLTERWTRRVFLLAFIGTLAGAITLSWSGR